MFPWALQVVGQRRRFFFGMGAPLVYKYLANAQSDRENADYDAIDDIGQKLAKKRIVEAEEFLKETNRFIWVCFLLKFVVVLLYF